MTYFMRLPSNKNLDRLVAPHLSRPVGRPPQSGIQVKIVDLHYRAKSWSRPRRVVAKIEWHPPYGRTIGGGKEELFRD